MTAPLTRATAGLPALPAPPRIAHLGLGGFARSHQAWYTQAARDAAEWGIVGYTGRRPDLAAALSRQDGLYTLLTAADDGDRAEIVSILSAAVPGGDTAAFVRQLADPRTALVTITITESAYRIVLDTPGDPQSDALGHDLPILAAAPMDVDGIPSLDAALSRLLLGLEHRRRADAGPIALVPCDNLSRNAAVLSGALADLAERSIPALLPYLHEQVGVVSTSVDRITPRTDAAVRARARAATGFDDEAPVVAEPFRDWLLCGPFPAGRPDWESAGARVVTEIEPFELRKLWLLNGAHSLMAYAGLARGHRTVAEAMDDPVVREWVEELWDEAAAHLPGSRAELDLDRYRSDLRERFASRAMRDELARIGMDGVAKLRARITPVLLAELAAGRRGTAAARALAFWVAAAGSDALPPDAMHEEIRAARAAADPRRALVALIDGALAEHEELLADLGELAAPAGIAR